ncbi:putative dynein ATPase [Helianthus annuus]|nr:putative dynein ATPase [Helianthus annuus]
MDINSFFFFFYYVWQEFDKVYGPAWHCIVGSNFGSFVTHATGCFLYFSMEKLYILVFKTKVKKV